VLASLAENTDKKVQGVFNAVEKYLAPVRLRDVTADRLSYLQAKLREAEKSNDTIKKRSENTIKGHLAHLMSALRWAVKVGMLAKAPEVTMPKRAKGANVMKGRPISGEEFDRMLEAVAKVLGDEKNPAEPAMVKSWQHYLRGLWLSGLRLAESLELSWDRDDKLCADMQPGEHPMLRIPAALEKGNQDRLLPMAPEFAEFLQETPQAERTGYVFKPMPQREKRSQRLGLGRVTRTVAEFGKKAGIKVTTHQATAKVKFASAHDLRRSFGLRWASRVMPQVLMELMRHESIDTTMRYYVGRNAQSTAAVLWAAHRQAKSNNSGNTPPENKNQPAPAVSTTASTD
jgi:integrase